MTLEEYREKESDYYSDYTTNLYNLRLEYAKSIAKFKVGDFIYNVTGIIKIERIGSQVMFGVPDVLYYGYKYKKAKGVLSRTNDIIMGNLGSNVKLLTI